jgi:hypothetical protein
MEKRAERRWSVTTSGAHVLDGIGVILPTRDHRFRAYTAAELGELALGPFTTLEQAKLALEDIWQRCRQPT